MRDYVVELVRESLVALVNEMRANMIYASYSSVIFEGHDFSCCLMSGDGRQVAMGRDDHPLHMFAVPTSTRTILDKFAGRIERGDVFLHNDPYTGGTHLNDILMLYPIFHGNELRFFAAVRAHWNDVGGMTPGSLSGQVTEIFQEGVRVPPVKIVNRGELQSDLLELAIANMRLPWERRGDFDCMLGACRKAESRVHSLFDKFGAGELRRAVETLIARSEMAMRRRIEALPDGEYFAEGYVESNGHSPEPLKISLRLVIAGSRLVADFTGTSRQTAGPTNVGPAMASNAVFTIVKSFLDPLVPVNHGAFAPVEVIAPLGSFINARAPAPCGGMAEVKFAIDSVVAAALSQAIPEKRIGDLKGTANHTHIAGIRDDTGERFILYEWPAGGTGASRCHDGNNAVRTFTEGDFNSIQSVEVVESSSPIRIERCEIRADSCGWGRNQGGFGMVREVRLLCERGSLSVLSDRNVIPPYGVNGGESSAPNHFSVVRGKRVLEPSAIPGKVSGFPLQRNDLVRIETAGGGAYGDPLERDPERVAADVVDGYVSAAAARSVYGVCIRSGGVLRGETTRRRGALRRARQTLPLNEASREQSNQTQRQVWIDAASARKCKISTGDLVEIVGANGLPLRAWAQVDKSLQATGLTIDSSGLRLLRERVGSRVLVRRLSHRETFDRVSK